MTIHLAFLTIAAVLAYFWTKNPTLSFYNLQLTAGLIVLYFLKNLKKPSLLNSKFYILNSKIIDAVILTLIILLLVFSTGGISSELFFLIYFLLFGLSFGLAPGPSGIFAAVIAVIFLSGAKTSADFLRGASLIFIAPLAVFFGKLHLTNLVNQKRIKIYKTKWLEDERSLENEETSILLWLALNFRKGVAEILETTALLLSDIGKLTPNQKYLLKKMRRKLKRLLQQGKKLQSKIDKETDEG